MRIGVIIGTGLKLEGEVRAVPSSDRTALALAALKLDCKVAAYSLDNDDAGLRYALAGGAASAKRIENLQEIEFDVMLIGQGGCGAWGDLLPAVLAENRGSALVLDVVDVEFSSDGLRVTRDLGRGAREILRVQVPAVLCISPNAQRLTYVSRYRQLSVAPGGTPGGAELTDPTEGDSSSWQPAKPRTKTGAISEKTSGSAADRMNALMGASGAARANDEEHIVQADAATCSKQLLRYLAHHGFIEGSEPDGSVEAKTSSASVPPPQSSETVPFTPTQRRHTGRGPRKLDRDSKTSGRRPSPIRVPKPVEKEAEIEEDDRKPRAVDGGKAKPRRGPRPLD